MVRDTPPSQDVSTHKSWNSYLKGYRRYGPDTKAGRTDRRTDGWTDSAITICLPKFLWGHKKLVFKYPYNHLQDNNMLSSLQSGFIPGDSTVNQLAYLYHMFTEALDAGKEVWTVFWDISKAFDCVWHEGLFCKLKAAGVSGDVLRWFQSYLSGGRQRVVLPGSFSEWVYIKA